MVLNNGLLRLLPFVVLTACGSSIESSERARASAAPAETGSQRCEGEGHSQGIAQFNEPRGDSSVLYQELMETLDSVFADAGTR
jgi:hypothetical protein